MVVLLVLAALIALATPFLLSMRNEARATGGRVDMARARVAALGAREHARRVLSETHAGKDLTPLFDGPEELEIPKFPNDFFSAGNPRGEIWSAAVEDEQGKVHLNSASPFVFGRLLDSTALTKDLSTEETEISVLSTDGFPPEGFLWIRGELIRYLAKTANSFEQCQRGFLSDTKRFLEPQKHRQGSPVLDDRVCALARYRIADPGIFRGYDTLLSLPRAGEATVAGAMSQEELDPIQPLCTVFSKRGGAGNWSAACRVVSPLVAGESSALVVANSRFVAEGATVRIWGKDGKTEYALVVESNPFGGQVRLAAPVAFDYDPYEAQLQTLLRHPVNVNTARPDLLVRLLSFLHLRRGGAQDWVTPEEAGEVVKRLVAARPIRGFQDFLLRVLRPALEDEAISASDLQAIYRNALNAEDGGLGAPSMPFSFAIGDVFHIASSVSINTPMGSERARATLREVMALAPQEPLLFLLGNQEAFEEQFRLTREARYWTSGPRHVGMYDGDTSPPSRDVAQVQQGDPQDEYFPSDDFQISWAGSQVARKEPAGPQASFEHFDYSWNPEGRRLDNWHWKGDPSAKPASLAAQGGLLFPGTIEAWFRPKTWNGVFFDLGAGFTNRNRIQLLVDQQDLVLRAFDDAGDDPDTPQVEAGEIRLPLAGLAGSADTWTHLSMSWKGNRPNDLSLMVDGVQRGTRRAFTKLTSNLSDFVPTATAWTQATIPVESTEGFPDSGVLRIGGTEIVEYASKTANAFRTAWPPKTGSGLDTWMAGRESRLGKNQANLPNAVAVQTSHAMGAGVELYGYSAILQSNLPSGGATMGLDLGKFSVGRLVTGDPSKEPGDSIGLIGSGILGNSTKKWKLESVENPSDTKFMNAFSKNGGYALVFQGNGNGTAGYQGVTYLFGAELVHYQGWSGTILDVDQRKITTSKLTPGSMPGFDGTAHAFVTKWNSGPGFDLTALDTNPCAYVYVVPVSIRVAGFNGVQYEANPSQPNLSDIVQVYDSNDEGKTEWIRFDEVLQGHLLRSDPHALQSARNAIDLANFTNFNDQYDDNCPASPDLTKPAAPQPLSIGLQEILNPNSVVFRVWASMKHRGVMGTFSHDQKASAKLIPVFQVPRNSGNRPGRNDRVAVLDAGGGQLPAWKTVNWAHYPDVSDNVPNSQNLVDLNRIYLAFKEMPGIPMAQQYPTGVWNEDGRSYPRIVKFPSGELPLDVNAVTAGNSHDGAGPKVEGELDEIEFLSGTAPGTILAPSSLGSFLLQEDCNDAANSLILEPRRLGFAHGDLPYTINVLATLPSDGGLLRIDDEILGYIQVDAVSGVVTLSPNGRGMLGSEAAAHGKGSPVHFLDHVRASEITAGLSPYSFAIPVENGGKFSQEGTLLVDQELIHFTYKAGGILGMPSRKREEPDEEYRDKDEGIFRGRFGTPPASHAAGTLAIHFPFRYWDRGPQRTDVAELSFFGAHLEAPGGWFQTLFWEEDPSLRDPFVRLEALARVDDWAAWDGEPGVAPGLYLFDRPTQDGGRVHRIDRGGDRLELRFYTRYLPGAFDAIGYQSHSWKRAPKLRKAAVEYHAPNRVLWRAETRW